jgi:uncharacterized membrane protein YphA (DoxX/SURF4 family)/peroxiredoxin
MTIYTLNLYVFIAALILTGIFSLIRRPQSWLVEVCKNFLGSMLIFSGYVKAVDPTGTAFKMQQYFAEFSSYGLSGLWETLSGQAQAFSVFMIVLEFVLGIALILGRYRKFTFWLLIPMMVFFTFLTGFTSYTGKVTDCGCFGDFLKIKPIVSFSKDIFLMVICGILLLGYQKITPLFKQSGLSLALLVLGTLGTLYFCFSNYLWDEPCTDFRPFREGVNLPQAKEAALADQTQVRILYTYVNKATNETKQLEAKELGKHPELWQKGSTWYNDTTRLQREVLHEGSTSKVKDFEIENDSLGNITDSLMAIPGYSMMIVLYDRKKTHTEAFAALRTLVSEATKNNIPVYGVTSHDSHENIEKYRHEHQLAFPIYTADDLVLKTMIRSNPGVFLFKEGTIVKKWHYKQLPDFATIKQQHIK